MLPWVVVVASLGMGVAIVDGSELSIHIAGFFPMGLNVSEGAVGRGNSFLNAITQKMMGY